MTLRNSVIFFCLLLDFFQKFGYLLLNTVFSPMPGWRNGRRSRLKICFPQGVRVRSPSRVPTFFLRKKKVGQRKTAYRFFEKSLAKTPAVFFYRRGVFFVWLLGVRPLPRFDVTPKTWTVKLQLNGSCILRDSFLLMSKISFHY